MNYRAGDAVEVRFGGGWVPASIDYISPGGRARVNRNGILYSFSIPGTTARADHYMRKPEETNVTAPALEAEWSSNLNAILEEVQAVMESRHAKYGSGNIAKRGIPGILTRLDDKFARIDNTTADFADESYRDAWLDVVGYGLIAVMWIDGNWPGSGIQD